MDVLTQLETDLVRANKAEIRAMVPSFEKPINSDPTFAKKILKDTAKVLKLSK